MGVLEDLRDFIYLELPERPVLIKGSDASGDPNDSTVAKVNGSPIGTYYLRDDVVPKTIQYKAGTTSTDQYKLAKDVDVTGGGDGTTMVIDTTSLPEIVLYSLGRVSVKNRFLHYTNSIPSNLVGQFDDTFRTIKKITFTCDNTNSDNTAVIEDLEGNLITSVSMSSPNKISTNDVSILISPNTGLRVFVISSNGVNYPVLKMEIV